MFILIHPASSKTPTKFSFQTLARALLGLVFSLFIVVSTNAAMAGVVRVKIDISSQKKCMSWSMENADTLGRFQPRAVAIVLQQVISALLVCTNDIIPKKIPRLTNAIFDLLLRWLCNSRHKLHQKKLGRPASHGCIRLHPKNARQLFALVRNNGPPKRTKITIQR